MFVGVEVHNRDETARLIRRLRRHGLKTIDLSDNEMAKLHVRHLVGGHAAARQKTSCCTASSFRSAPGALMKFLDSMRPDWNISLFHYRNHGADYGRVLVGMQVPPREMPVFHRFLRDLGYPFWEETRNPAYKLFLG